MGDLFGAMEWQEGSGYQQGEAMERIKAAYLTVDLRNGVTDKHPDCEFWTDDGLLVVEMGKNLDQQVVRRRYPLATVLRYTTTGEVGA
jgi:hypothetical protein